MPIELRLDENRAILYVTARGEVTEEEFRLTLERMTGSAALPPDTDALWDLRELDLRSVDADFWRRILEIRARYPQRGTARLAHVVAGEAAFGMLRMYQILSELDPHRLPQKVSVFHDIAEAEAWLLAGPRRGGASRPST